MDKKTKNLFKSLTVFATLAMTIGLVTTLSVGEKKEQEYICDTDKLLNNYTLVNEDNSYPNGVNDYPSYSTGLEYAVDTSSGSGTLLDPYRASVARGRCTLTDVVLPEYFKDSSNNYYKVMAIDQDGFNAHKPAKNADGSEIGCYDLTSITSLKDFVLVGSQAFAYTSLTTVEFSHNLAELSPSTFFHCKNLETTNFIRLDGEAESTTGTYAAIASVGNNCFTDCVNYTGMILPRTLTNIGAGAYQNCLSLTSIFLPATSVGSQTLDVGDYAFAGCSKVTIVYLSSKVKSIGAHAFEGCTNAKGYSALPYSELLARLGKSGNGDWNYLFNDSTYDSAGNYDVYLDFSARDSKGDLMYDQPYFYSFNEDGGVTLDVYDGSVSGDSTKTYLYNVIRTIPSTRGAGYPVTRIGQELFKNNTDMTSLVIPSSVKIIGRAAFAGCTNLEQIALSAGLEKIDHYAFAPWNGEDTEMKSNKLTSLQIPKTVKWIGDYAFPYMYEMMNIEFLGSDEDESALTHIGRYAFYKAGDDYKNACYQGGSFTEVRNPLVLRMHPVTPNAYVKGNANNNNRPTSGEDTYTEICDYAFYGNQWIGSIRIASDTLVIDAYVFADCYWLVEANLGEGVKIMGNGKHKNNDKTGRGRTFAMTIADSTINDLGGPLDRYSDATIKPYVPMSNLYLPMLDSGQYVGWGTLNGRYQTMVYTSGLYNQNSRYYFQWCQYDADSDIEPTYLDRGSAATNLGDKPANILKPAGNDMYFSNDVYNGDNSDFDDYYGVDTAGGASYLQDTYTEKTSYYQIKQGGYYNVKYAYATVTSQTVGLTTTYSTSYKDSSGNPITSINSQYRYGFTTYDSTTGRAKFDFVQTEADSDYVILTKFHYNPYWEQSKDVVIPQTVTFGGRTFTVSEIGNCAFFRNICPQSHAWVGTSDSGTRTYVSPQTDNHSTNPNKDSNNKYYSDYNDDYYNLETVVLPDTIERIGGNAFYMCAGLRSIKTAGNNTEGRFPSRIERIQQYAFSFTGITAVSLPNTIALLGNPYGLCNPFTSCMALTSISIDAGGTTTFKSLNNCITNLAGTEIVMGAAGTTSTTLTIPSDVTTLKSQAFRGARKITNIVIPAGLTTIEDGCFDEIHHGETRRDNQNKPEYSYKGVYSRGRAALDKITVSGGGTSNLTTIGSFAFYNCEQFDGIDFPNTLETIGGRAFYYCTGANKYYIPNSLKHIGTEAFYKNTSFDQIKTDGKPNGETVGYLNLAATKLTTLERNAFNVTSTKFDTVSFPKTLTSMNSSYVFAKSYTGLKTVYVHNNTTSMNGTLYESNTNLVTFKTWSGDVDANGDIQNVSASNTLPSNLTHIGSSCFASCSKLQGFSSFPATMKSVGKLSFSGCSDSTFTTANFSASTANLTIYSEAFSGCTSLTTLNLVSGAGSRSKVSGSLKIEASAFKNCTSLTSVIIPTGAEVISGAFDGSGMQSIFVGDTYDNARGKVGSDVGSGTSALVYFYAGSVPDKGTAPEGTLFWHYEGTTATPWTPA